METYTQRRAISSYFGSNTRYNLQRIRRAPVDEERKGRKSTSTTTAAKKFWFARKGWIEDHLRAIQILDRQSHYKPYETYDL